MSAVVETSAGRIQGASERGLYAFRGVPYAAPPTGSLRFRPPQPPAPWAGVRQTTRSGPAAPQLALPVFSWINAAARAPGNDCLSLNVFTPGLDGARRPVLIWIHGGGFLVGSGSTVVYEGQALAEHGDVVVVTINYRLGAQGFCHLGTVLGDEFAESTNLGVRDQIAALEWVRDHIDRFGGDPDNVTVFGQSAGGMSVGTLLGAPRARKLFHRAICQSGAADHVIEWEEARFVASELLRRLGGPPPSLEALGRLPIETLLEAQNSVMADLGSMNSLMLFLPMVDGDVVPMQPLEAIRRGETAAIPILTGSTLEEWKLFQLADQGIGRFDESDLRARFADVLPDDAPAPADAARSYLRALGERSAARSPREVWSAFQTARVFHLPSARLAEAQYEGGGSVHSYLVTWRAPAARRALGACHAIEIPFVFGNEGNPLARPFSGLSRDGARFGRRIRRAWLSFARRGDPSHDRLPTWPRYRPDERATMVLGRRCSLADAPLDAERELLTSWRALRMASVGRPMRRAEPLSVYLQPSTS
ncbi:MAG: carboxylesterase/lipase family protein [Myxococcota bacterium]